jgi:hypothetical protein
MLLLAVPLDGGWVLLAIPPPVIRMTGAPLLRAVAAYLTIFRIRGDLPAVILGATAAWQSGLLHTNCPGWYFDGR